MINELKDYIITFGALAVCSLVMYLISLMEPLPADFATEEEIDSFAW